MLVQPASFPHTASHLSGLAQATSSGTTPQIATLRKSTVVWHHTTYYYNMSKEHSIWHHSTYYKIRIEHSRLAPLHRLQHQERAQSSGSTPQITTPRKSTVVWLHSTDYNISNVHIPLEQAHRLQHQERSQFSGITVQVSMWDTSLPQGME